MITRTVPQAARRPWSWAFALPLAAVFMALAVPPARADEPNVLTPFSKAAGEKPPEPWRFTTLPRKAPTTFEVVSQDGRRVLRVEADQSYGNLVHATHLPLASAPVLAWRWRVEEFVAGADLRTRSGDDGAAKLCVFFDFPVERLSFGERAKLALARSTTGEDVPSEVLCYVWDNKEPKGAALVNAFTQRMRMAVLESGAPATPGAWVSERRNLVVDYRKAFGDEAGSTLPDVVAVAISADADNTHGHGLAYFSDVDLHATAAPAQGGAASAASPSP